MTKHKIEYEEMVEKSKEVAVCNGCGTEVDSDVETYVSSGHGETTEIHLHHECEADLLATSEPDFDTDSLKSKLPHLALRERFSPYIAAIKYIVAFALLPVTFVHVTRFIGKTDDNPEGAVFFIFCIWLVAAFVGALVML